MLDGDKVLALNDLGRKLAGPRADLRAFDGPFGPLAVNQVVENIRKIAGKLRAIGLVAPGFHDPVDDVEAEPLVVEAGLLVEQRTGLDAAHIPLLTDRGLQVFSDNMNPLGVRHNPDRTGRLLGLAGL